MIALVADDDRVSRLLLSRLLEARGHHTATAADGTEAWQWLERAEEPVLAVLDWMMPGLEGPELCRRARERPATAGSYLLLLTARDRREDVVTALQAGADDHVAKPFHRGELEARLRVGERVLQLQAGLHGRIRELEQARRRIRTLEELLAICSYCKKIRTDEGDWEILETSLARRTGASFTHGVCPSCLAELTA